MSVLCVPPQERKATNTLQLMCFHQNWASASDFQSAPGIAHVVA
jgi:hypothetical protein